MRMWSLIPEHNLGRIRRTISMMIMRIHNDDHADGDIDNDDDEVEDLKWHLRV